MTHGVYRITGRRAFRGHQPGETVVMSLDPAAEQRAIQRGNILLLDRIEPRLPDLFELPEGWLTS